MRVIGYLGMLAVVVIAAVWVINIMRASFDGSGTVETGSQKAARELSEPGEPALDPGAEMRGAVQDAMSR